MLTGPRYKRARRLGPNVYDKTQTQKFAVRSEARAPKKGKFGGSDFGVQLIEKQKAKFTYGLNERQFKKMVETISEGKSQNLNQLFVENLERRLDNVIYRLGFAKTRQASRQMVNHGHININGKRQTIPSYAVSVGDVITIRELSAKKPLFANLEEMMKEKKIPSWLTFDNSKKEAKVQGMPKIPDNELSFDIAQIFQFYSR